MIPDENRRKADCLIFFWDYNIVLLVISGKWSRKTWIKWQKIRIFAENRNYYCANFTIWLLLCFISMLYCRTIINMKSNTFPVWPWHTVRKPKWMPLKAIWKWHLYTGEWKQAISIHNGRLTASTHQSWTTARQLF